MSSDSVNIVVHKKRERYEYCIVTTHHSHILKSCNDQGKAGWLLVDKRELNTGTGNVELLFARTIAEIIPSVA